MARTIKQSKTAGTSFKKGKKTYRKRRTYHIPNRFRNVINAAMRTMRHGNASTARGRTAVRASRARRSRVPAALRGLNSSVVQNVQRSLAAEAAAMNTNNARTRRSGRIAIVTAERRAREVAEAEARAAEAARQAVERAATAARRAAEAERRAAERAAAAEARAAQTAAYENMLGMFGSHMRMSNNNNGL
jgi:hypothetical protein